MTPPTLLEILIGSIPMLLLLGFLYLVAIRVAGPRKHPEQRLEEMRRQTALLERIATALETKSK